MEITNSTQTPDTLADTDPNSNGILSFFRLVGCAYFRKHKAAFLPTYLTPMSLFNSLAKDNQTHLDHHSAWLSFLRERVWSRIKYEEEMIPSDNALLWHWQRSCWVVAVWKQATQNQITYPPLQGNGWKLDNNCLHIEWDSDDNISKVRIRVALLKKGCGCCQTGRYKCKKNNNNNPCGPGCKCVGCCNMPKGVSPGQANVKQEDNVDSCESEADLLEEVDDVINEIFGTSTQSDSDGDDN